MLGTGDGNFQFAVASPAGPLPNIHWHVVPRMRGGVQRFRSRPDLVPPAVSLSRPGRTSPGDIFIGAQGGPFQQGPMIINGRGDLVWFKRLSGNDSAMDFRVQTYQGRRVLTWWQGNVSAGVGRGAGMIY